MPAPDRPLIDFDHNAPEYARHSDEVLHDLRTACPFGFSEKHGGYWVATGFEQGARVFQGADFSVAKYVDEKTGEVRGGTTVPSIATLEMIPNELDPPEWNGYRRLLNPVFAPAAVERRRSRISALANELIDTFIENGEADLVLDFANLLPASSTIDLLGLDQSDLDLFSEPFHLVPVATPGSPDWDRAMQLFAQLPDVIRVAIAARRSQPADDYITTLVTTTLDGKPLDDDTIVRIIVQLLAGGVDSTATLLANTFMYLNDHPEDRQRLVDDPALLRTATEEFVRYSTPIQNVARTAVTTTNVADQIVERREPVLISMAAMNRDSSIFADPDDVVLDRMPNRHAGWGMGIHRCLGSNFARVMFQEALVQLLRRVPDFVIDVERAEPFRLKGIINGWVKMPARFTPGSRLRS